MAAEAANQELSQYVGQALAEHIDDIDDDIVDLARDVGAL